jgi:hypothetical protein
VVLRVWHQARVWRTGRTATASRHRAAARTRAVAFDGGGGSPAALRVSCGGTRGRG